MLHPRYRFHHITKIPPDWLAQRGIAVVLLDVDNTLTTHNNPVITPEVIGWLDAVKATGVRMLILSNNSAERVAPLAAQLGLGFISRALKPLWFGVRHACNQLQTGRGRVAVIGDQIFTDVLCANLAGVISILVEPIEAEAFWGFRLKRKLEKIVLKTARAFEEDET